MRIIRNNGPRIAMVIGFIGVVIALVFSGTLTGVMKNSTANAASNAQANAEELLKALTIGATRVPPCTQYAPSTSVKDGIVLADYGYKASVANGSRYTADALSTPISGSTDQQRLASIAYKVCSDPMLGYAYGNMLYGVQIGNTGKTIGDVNSWLKSAHADQTTSTALVTWALPNAGKSDTSLTPGQKAQTIAAWVSYEDYASKVVAILNVYNVVGVEPNPLSTANWHFANNGAVVGSLPVVVLNDRQENLPAFVLVLKFKGQTCEISRIGGNPNDARPEVFKPEGCTPPPAPASSTTTTTKSQPAPPPVTSSAVPPPHTSTTAPPPGHPPTPTTPPTTKPTTPPHTTAPSCGPGYNPDCTKIGTAAPPPTLVSAPPGTDPLPADPKSSGYPVYCETTGSPGPCPSK